MYARFGRGVDSMSIRLLNKITGFSFVALLGMVSPAEAGTIGSTLDNLTGNLAYMPKLVSTAAYLIGLLYAISGIYKFKAHVDSPGNNPISDAIKRFLAGGMLFSLPFMGNALIGTWFNGSTEVLIGGAYHGRPAAAGMDQMIYDLVKNFAGPMTFLLRTFVYISGALLLVVGITRLTKTAQEGPRGPTGMGTIMTFLVAGALFSCAGMMAVFSNSLFGSNTVSTFAVIDPTIIGQAAADQVAPVIEAVMAFIMVVGYIAFIRGWFALKAFADGGSNAPSIAQGLTFLFGGALAINLGELVNVLANTVGVTAIQFN